MAINQFRKYCPKSSDHRHDLIDITPVDKIFELLQCTHCNITVSTGKIHPDRQSLIDNLLKATP